MTTSPDKRREALVELLFEHYYPQLPSGQVVPSRDEWPEGWVAAMATTPPILDLDNRLLEGVEILARFDQAAWQAWRS